MTTMNGGSCLHYDCSNRNSFGQCRSTVCINEHYQQEQWGLSSTTNKSESVVKKPRTNADHIRNMTDEEIEVWYWWMNKKMMGYTDSRMFVHDWLKAPAGRASDDS